jgi:hypothetical protein
VSTSHFTAIPVSVAAPYRHHMSFTAATPRASGLLP